MYIKHHKAAKNIKTMSAALVEPVVAVTAAVENPTNPTIAMPFPAVCSSFWAT
jgi:hypothetical protein